MQTGTSDTSVPQPTPFEKIGGEEKVRQIVDRFYDLMDSDPAYAALRAIHGGDLAEMRASLSGFLSGWLGGPRQWFEEHPGMCIMSRHRALRLTAETAAQWLDAMRRALADTQTDPATADLMFQAFLRMARNMVAAP